MVIFMFSCYNSNRSMILQFLQMREEFQMALIKCTECGKEISDKATTCPNCGAPVGKKYCSHCGSQIDLDCVVCPKCGKQVGALKQDKIVINNSASSSSSASASATASVNARYAGRAKNKWVSLLLCLFTICGHKFYEGKILMGFVYLFTCGLFFVGWIIDIFALLSKPNPYYV